MLTLKAPIQLHIAQNLTGNAEAFGERIRGNYGLLGAHFAAKDLLFLMTAPPELPEDLGGMTTLVNQQNTVDVRSVTMEVVNNVVNRILLDGTEQFTYQDQVYITTVLNRLGITNVAQFMEQVRQLRVENESTVHMTKLYREELERILQRQAAGENAPVLPLIVSREEETAPQSVDPRVTLCMEILNRLDTTNLYETVHAFQRNWSGGVNIFRNQELKLSEQLRFSNAVSLAEIKQQVYQQPNLHLLHHLNAYETGTLLEAPRDEEEVLSQAAAAALVSAVDNTVVEVLNRPQFRQEQWVQVQNALWQVAENTLSRFETYHSQPQLSIDLSVRTDAAWNNYVQELKEYQTLYRQMYPKALDIPAPLPERREDAGTFLTYLTKEGETEETLLERSAVLRETDTEKYYTENVLRENRQQTIQELLRTAGAIPGGTVVPPGDIRNATHLNQIREGDLIRRQENGERLTVEKQTAIRKLIAAQELRHLWPPNASAHTVMLHRERDYWEREQVVRESRETAEPLPPVRERVETAMSWLEPRQRTEPQSVPPVQPLPLTSREAEEQAPEVLLEEMTRIDQHNRTVLQAVQAESRRKETQIPTGPDIRRTMRDALRALNEPESVLREVYAQREKPAAMDHPELTPREEALLRQAEPENQAVYEAVLAYRKNPEEVLAKGLLKPANLGALHAELQKAAREEAPLELEHPGEEAQRQRELLREQSEAVLERFHHLPVRPRSIVEETAPLSAVKIVHKQAALDVTEELLEQLEEQRSRSAVHTDTHEEVTYRQSHQVDVNQMEHKVVAQTTEDITELVNRTLARQMRTISDQVYRQMEKRLQAERSRRGRL